ncbi:MurR/RpiR family transcriptional regulator [Vibrio sp. MA40-2]|uniref:MurR/RpiR family transcriptional regulator n=1 Tax=Vibrio sp. MA40-2 TaxID=3391828 RepID=UPI0039A5DE67
MKKLISLSESSSDAEMRIAKQLLNPDIDISEMSAIALGRLCGVSNASIVRFAQSLGYKGYSVFKFDFVAAQKNHNSSQIFTHFDHNGSSKTIIESSANLLQQHLHSTFEHVSDKTIEVASKALHQSSRVVILALGTSSIVANAISQKLMLLNKAVIFQADAIIQEQYLLQFTGNDVVLALSVAGGTEQINSKIATAKACGCKIVSITQAKHSKLHELSDVVLPFIYDEGNAETISSIVQISQLALFDVVFNRLVAIEAETNPHLAAQRKQAVIKANLV